MNRILGHIAALAVAFTMAVAPAMGAQLPTEPIAVAAPDNQEITITVQGNTVHITGAAKQALVAYYLTGAKAATYAIDSDEKTITLNLPKGVYLLKVGKVVRKVSL